MENQIKKEAADNDIYVKVVLTYPDDYTVSIQDLIDREIIEKTETIAATGEVRVKGSNLQLDPKAPVTIASRIPDTWTMTAKILEPEAGRPKRNAPKPKLSEIPASTSKNFPELRELKRNWTTRLVGALTTPTLAKPFNFTVSNTTFSPLSIGANVERTLHARQWVPFDPLTATRGDLIDAIQRTFPGFDQQKIMEKLDYLYPEFADMANSWLMQILVETSKIITKIDEMPIKASNNSGEEVTIKYSELMKNEALYQHVDTSPIQALRHDFTVEKISNIVVEKIENDKKWETVITQNKIKYSELKTQLVTQVETGGKDMNKLFEVIQTQQTILNNAQTRTTQIETEKRQIETDKNRKLYPTVIETYLKENNRADVIDEGYEEELLAFEKTVLNNQIDQVSDDTLKNLIKEIKEEIKQESRNKRQRLTNGK